MRFLPFSLSQSCVLKQLFVCSFGYYPAILPALLNVISFIGYVDSSPSPLQRLDACHFIASALSTVSSPDKFLRRSTPATSLSTPVLSSSPSFRCSWPSAAIESCTSSSDGRGCQSFLPSSSSPASEEGIWAPQPPSPPTSPPLPRTSFPSSPSSLGSPSPGPAARVTSTPTCGAASTTLPSFSAQLTFSRSQPGRSLNYRRALHLPRPLPAVLPNPASRCGVLGGGAQRTRPDLGGRLRRGLGRRARWRCSRASARVWQVPAGVVLARDDLCVAFSFFLPRYRADPFHSAPLQPTTPLRNTPSPSPFRSSSPSSLASRASFSPSSARPFTSPSPSPPRRISPTLYQTFWASSVIGRAFSPRSCLLRCASTCFFRFPSLCMILAI